MNILLLHNRYQKRGGEDLCVEAHQELLRAKGHRVRLLEAANDAIGGWTSQAKTALTAVYSRKWKARVAAELAAFPPDLAHIHNTFPLLTPAVIYACKQARVPVVQTFHNYRLGCPNALLYRRGRICEECLGRGMAWKGVLRGCYRGSRIGTAVVAGVYAAHRLLRTYSEAIDVGIALSEFARSKLTAAGLPESKLVVVPNWLEPDPGTGRGEGGYFLFVGRLSPEKGVGTLLRAWQEIGERAPLRIVGGGPLEPNLRAQPAPGVSWLGWKAQDETLELLRQAKALILPSECYENFPRVVAEAFATGTPVIAPRLGSLQEIVQHRRTGLHFDPGDSGQLAQAVRWLSQHPGEAQEMRHAARLEYETRYSAERVYPLLLAAYDRALAAGLRSPDLKKSAQIHTSFWKGAMP